MNLRTKLAAVGVSIALALGTGVVVAAPASAGNLTQVCYSSSSPDASGVPVKLMGYSGYVSLAKGQCRWGVEAIALFSGKYHITDYGTVSTYGEYRTPLNKTYVVTNY